MSNVIRKIVGVITLSIFSFFIGCEVVPDELEPIIFELNSGLFKDSNGYYHMNLDTNSVQTLHRLSGRVLRNGEPVNVIKFAWASNMYWIINDDFGYVIQNTGSEELWYVGYDTTHITWFSGWEVPIVNGSSYSREDGEVNTMLAPVRSMRGDTATIHYGYHDNWTYEDTFGEFKIIFN